jgi:hypothetical protein
MWDYIAKDDMSPSPLKNSGPLYWKILDLPQGCKKVILDCFNWNKYMALALIIFI